MSFLWQGFKILKQVVQLNSNLYPEILKQVLLVRPPQKFQDVWKVAEVYFEPRTWEKIILVPPAQTAKVLRAHVPDEHIPRFLGGPKKSAAPIARKIPRRLLRWFNEQGPKPPMPVSPLNPQVFDMTSRMCGLNPSRLLKHNNSVFLEKEATLPKSSWSSNGALPPTNSWGALCDVPRAGDATALLELLDVDMFRSSEEDPIMHVYNHPSLAPHHFRRQGNNRFFLIVNWVTGDHQMTVLAAVPAGGEMMSGPGSTGGDLHIWQRFLRQPCAQKWRRFRVGVKLFEAPWIVHQLVQPHQSSFLGKLLPGHHQGDNYLEITIRLTQSAMRCLCVVFRHSCHLTVFGLTYSLVADTPADPPETLLFAHYCSRVDVERVRQVQAQAVPSSFSEESVARALSWNPSTMTT